MDGNRRHLGVWVTGVVLVVERRRETWSATREVVGSEFLELDYRVSGLLRETSIGMRTLTKSQWLRRQIENQCLCLPRNSL